jgi:prolyl-tRNA editing enzyme YbaK/EbsC (Cys-tRNA(Pro) deacylase)
MTSTEDADTTAAGVIDHPAGGQDSDDHDRSDHPAVARVLEVLAAFGMTTTVRHLPDAVRTAKAAADALAITPAEIANSLVFAADAGDGSTVTPLLVLASGGRQVDLIKVADALELPPLRRATPEEVRGWTGFAIGGVAPVGHLTPLRTVVDVSLARFPVVWAAAGHSHSVFATSYADLLTLTAGTPLEVV